MRALRFHVCLGINFNTYFGLALAWLGGGGVAWGWWVGGGGGPEVSGLTLNL